MPVSLVTGGSGFFGTHLAHALLARGDTVRLLDPAEPAEELLGEVEWARAGVLDPEALEAACRGVGVVYHTAALVPLSKAGSRFADVNERGTAAVADVCLREGLRMVHVSSSAVYDPDVTPMPITEDAPPTPLGDYGRSKLAAERAVLDRCAGGLDGVVIRPRTIVDTGRGGIFQILYDWLLHDKKVYVLGDGSNAFQLVSAADLSSACILAAETEGVAGETVDVGTDRFGTYEDLLRALIAHSGSGSRIVHVNASLARGTLRVLDALRLSPLADWHYLTIDKPFFFDISKAGRLLGWEPRDSNDEMMARSYDWYVVHREELESRHGTTHRQSPRQRLLGILKRLS